MLLYAFAYILKKLGSSSKRNKQYVLLVADTTAHWTWPRIPAIHHVFSE